MGTAFKLEQYFAEFEYTFSQTGISFIAPIFPWMSQYSLSLSVIVIVLEMVLGLFLLLGLWKKWTAWLFFAMILFFTFLTGFTYLTGFVPSDAHFFQFSQWGPFVKSNMKVTDCGCFGDFIKLEPKVSFLKDVFLLIPALLFLFRYKDMHTLMVRKPARLLTATSIFILLVYAMYNFYWNEPHIDFRPFKEGINIRERKQAEAEALANVEVTIVMKNLADGRIVKLPYDQWMKEFKQYPKEEWEYLEQEKSEPAIPQTKISEFMVEDLEGMEVGDDILEYEDYQIIVICHYHKGTQQYKTVRVRDTIMIADTVLFDDGTVHVVEEIDEIIDRDEERLVFQWDESYINTFKQRIFPWFTGAENSEIRMFGIVGKASNESIADFQDAIGFDLPFYKADDILLKTILRSNPGVLLMKDGVIIKKWHIRQLPEFEKMFKRYLNN